MPMFRKKPVVIEAIQYTGENKAEILAFATKSYPDHDHGTDSIYIGTLEGDHCASVGDWIIKGVKGEFYPCKPDIFEATYEPAV